MFGSDGGGYVETVEPDDRRDATGARTRSWQLLAAAVVGVVLGAGVTWVVADRSGNSNTTPPRPAAVAGSSTLSGYGGNVATGVIHILHTKAGPELRIDFTSPHAGKGFVQVWLLDAKTGGMVPLGVLDGRQGTFAVPRALNLAKYNQVDVSLEPFDGNPAHSTDSLARGPLP